MSIQWYPGHIAKVERELNALLKYVDVVIEVLDARIPQASTNARLRKRYSGWPVLTLLNKADLADPKQNKQWVRQCAVNKAEHSHSVMLYHATAGKTQKQIIQALIALGEAKMKALETRGMKRRALRVAVVGMPNVGKSSIINSLVGTHRVKTGHKAGVTRQPQWVRIHERVELLDTPGIIPPKLDSEEAGALLATVSSVGEAAFDDEEVANFLLHRITSLYPSLLQRHYDMQPESPIDFEKIAQQRHYVLPGGTPDLSRACIALLTEFRQGRLGRLTLEHAAD